MDKGREWKYFCDSLGNVPRCLTCWGGRLVYTRIGEDEIEVACTSEKCHFNFIEKAQLSLAL